MERKNGLKPRSLRRCCHVPEGCDKLVLCVLEKLQSRFSSSQGKKCLCWSEKCWWGKIADAPGLWEPVPSSSTSRLLITSRDPAWQRLTGIQLPKQTVVFRVPRFDITKSCRRVGLKVRGKSLIIGKPTYLPQAVSHRV